MADSSRGDVKIAVPLKYLSNFWRSLEMPLISCKIYLELTWIENCVLPSAGRSATFIITDAKLHIPIVILSTKDNAKLAKQLNDGFKRSVYWNKYQTMPAKIINTKTNIEKKNLMHLFKVLKDYLLLPMMLRMIMELYRVTESVSFQEQR